MKAKDLILQNEEILSELFDKDKITIVLPEADDKYLREVQSMFNLSMGRDKLYTKAIRYCVGEYKRGKGRYFALRFPMDMRDIKDERVNKTIFEDSTKWMNREHWIEMTKEDIEMQKKKKKIIRIYDEDVFCEFLLLLDACLDDWASNSSVEENDVRISTRGGIIKYLHSVLIRYMFVVGSKAIVQNSLPTNPTLEQKVFRFNTLLINFDTGKMLSGYQYVSFEPSTSTSYFDSCLWYDTILTSTEGRREIKLTAKDYPLSEDDHEQELSATNYVTDGQSQFKLVRLGNEKGEPGKTLGVTQSDGGRTQTDDE